jgi:hypothetical protein
MSNKKRVFMPGNSFTEIRARLAEQPFMVFAKCGHCGDEMEAYAPSDNETAPITYDCYECELAWDSNGSPQNFTPGWGP